MTTVKTRAKKDVRNTSDAKENARNTPETLTSRGCDSRFKRSVRQRFAKRGLRSDGVSTTPLPVPRLIRSNGINLGSKPDSVNLASVSKMMERCDIDSPPAARLVGIELNPGPKGVKRPRKAAVAKKKRSQRIRRKGVGAGGGALQNRAGSIGRIGLGSTNVSGTTRRAQIIEEDEYIAEINGSVSFATTSYAINPGQSATFPWAYKIAGLYERYVFERLEFYYRREVSEYATNGQTGKVMLSIDYDASDSPPSTKQQVEDTIPHIDGMPCVEQILLRADPKELLGLPGGRYVRPSTLPVNTDIKTYDSGTLYVSTYGCANTNVIGELRVRYRCRLTVPVLESGSTVPAGQAGSQLLITSNPAGETAASSTVQGLLFASATTPVVVQNAIGATVASTGLITLPSGVYLIEGGNTGYASGGASNNTLELVQTSTLTNYASTGATHITSSGSTYPHTTDSVQLISFVLNTVTATSAVIGLSVALTYSGSGLNNAWLRVTLLSIAPTSVAAPLLDDHQNHHHVYEDRIQKLERMIARLNPTPLDSDFDIDDKEEKSSESATSHSNGQLSRSTVDLVTAIVRAKQSMPLSSSTSSK